MARLDSTAAERATPMSIAPGPFAPPSERDVTRLVLENPLA